MCYQCRRESWVRTRLRLVRVKLRTAEENYRLEHAGKPTLLEVIQSMTMVERGSVHMLARKPPSQGERDIFSEKLAPVVRIPEQGSEIVADAVISFLMSTPPLAEGDDGRCSACRAAA